MKLRCLQCSQYDVEINSNGQYSCLSCGFNYPYLGGIPVFVSDYYDYAGKKILFCEDSIRELEKDFLGDEKLSTPRIENLTTKINQSISFQISVLRDIQNALANSCPLSSLLQNIGRNQNLGYGISFEYLIRDWGFFPETEHEINIIKSAIFTKLMSKKKRALVLGAGLGRIAIEMLEKFDEVYAVDLALEMPFLLAKLMNDKKIEFDYFLKKNVKDEDSLFISAPINSAYIEDRISFKNAASNFNYFVASVEDLPFPDSSFDAIISCYFTDVVPLHSSLGEITRVLKTGGEFIHFGPLDFHFNDISDMLPLEDILTIFEQSNYKISRSEPVLLEHRSLPNRFNKKFYLNQLFSARKLRKVKKRKLNKTDVLLLNAPISFSLSGNLTEHGLICYKTAELRTDRNEIYSGALGVFEVIKKIDGKKDISTIFKELSKDYEITGDFKNQILDILSALEDKKTLSRLCTSI